MLSIKNIPIEKLMPNEKQPRKEFENGINTIESLAFNIKEHGLLNPITVKEQSNGNYLIVAGERRYRACIYLGFKSIGCTIVDTDNVDVVAVAENLARKDFTEVEKAEAIAKIRTQYESNVALSKAIGISEGYIRKLLKVNDLSDETKQDIQDKKVTADSAVKNHKTEVKKEDIIPDEPEAKNLKFDNKPDPIDISDCIMEISVHMKNIAEKYNNVESLEIEEQESFYTEVDDIREKYQKLYIEVCRVSHYVQGLMGDYYRSTTNS